MNGNMRYHVAGLTLAFAVAGALVHVGLATGQAPREPAQTEAEVLTRGPIHEAFAEPITFDPKPGPIVPKQPPEPVEELPPSEKPAGANVAWIPGYWHWDDDRNDFIWVSGLWRAIPPGRQWVPGYFHRAQGGYQWVAGYWATAEAQAVDYFPEPPDNLDNGPQGEPPSVQHVWTPGCWIWRETRYLWRPGYWILGQPGWAWCPAHYIWSPSGYVFIDGHWDYEPARRGVLFAPVVFASGIYRRPNYYFSPTIVIDVNIIVNHLFCRPHYHHYYFGDYYAASYLSAGIFPWFSFHLSREGYSPWFAYHRHHHGQRDPDWDDRLRDRYRRLRDNEAARPPRTYQEQLKTAQRTQVEPTAKEAVAKPLSQLAAEGGRGSPIRLQKLDEGRRKEIQRQAKEVRQAVAERGKTEGAARPPVDAETAREKKPQRLNLPQSSIRPGRERSTDRGTDRAEAPPARPQDPKPDVDARPRTEKPTRPPAADRIEGRSRRDDGTRPGAESPKPPARPPSSPPSKADPPPRESRPPAKPPAKPPSKPPGKKDGKDG